MSVRKIVGGLGLITLVVCFIIHLLTYRNINLAENRPAVWALFPIVIAIFLFTILTLYLKIGNRPPLRIFYAHTFALMPVWTWAVLIIFFGYMIVTTIFLGSGLVVPEENDGKYIINDHGRITEYTLQEVEMRKLNQLRSYSEFWIWLLLCSTLYLLTAKDDD